MYIILPLLSLFMKSGIKRYPLDLVLLAFSIIFEVFVADILFRDEI